jgi:hypothetical protein
LPGQQRQLIVRHADVNSLHTRIAQQRLHLTGTRNPITFAEIAGQAEVNVMDSRQRGQRRRGDGFAYRHRCA